VSSVATAAAAAAAAKCYYQKRRLRLRWRRKRCSQQFDHSAVILQVCRTHHSSPASLNHSLTDAADWPRSVALYYYNVPPAMRIIMLVAVAVLTDCRVAPLCCNDNVYTRRFIRRSTLSTVLGTVETTTTVALLSLMFIHYRGPAFAFTNIYLQTQKRTCHNVITDFENSFADKL